MSNMTKFKMDVNEEQEKARQLFAQHWTRISYSTLEKMTVTEARTILTAKLLAMDEKDFGLVYRLLRLSIDQLDTLEKLGTPLEDLE